MEEAVFNFEGKQYKISELTTEQLNCARHLDDLGIKLFKARMKVEQYQVVHDVISSEFRNLCLKEEKVEKNES